MSSPNINPALKPPKPRLPLKDIMVVTQDEDTTVPKRRVSFANVNKIKEFSAVAESMVVCHTPAYEEPFYMSSDSSYPSGIDGCTPGKSNLHGPEKSQMFQSKDNRVSSIITDQNVSIGNTPTDGVSRNCSKFSSDMELTEVVCKTTSMNLCSEMVTDVIQRVSNKTIFPNNSSTSEALEMTEAIHEPRISLGSLCTNTGDFTGNIVSPNKSRYSVEGMDLTKPLSSNNSCYSEEGMDLTKPICPRKSYSRRQSTRYSMSAMEMTEMIDDAALCVLDQTENIERTRSSTRYSIKDMETTEVIHVDYTRYSTNSMECTDVIDAKLDYSADSETSMEFTKPVNNICLSAPIYNAGSPTISSCSMEQEKNSTHDFKDISVNHGMNYKDAKCSLIENNVERSLGDKTADENIGNPIITEPENIDLIQSISNQISLNIDHSQSIPDYVFPSLVSKNKSEPANGIALQAPEPQLHSDHKVTGEKTSVFKHTIDQSDGDNPVVKQPIKEYDTLENSLKKGQIDESSRSLYLGSESLIVNSKKGSAVVIQVPSNNELKMSKISNDVGEYIENGHKKTSSADKQSEIKDFIPENNSLEGYKENVKSLSLLENENECATESMEILITETAPDAKFSEPVIIKNSKESEVNETLVVESETGVHHEINKDETPLSIPDHMGSESYTYTDPENIGEKSTPNKETLECITIEASSNCGTDSPGYTNISTKINNITLSRGCSNKSINQHYLTANTSYSTTVENTDQLEALPLLQRLALKDKVELHSASTKKTNGAKRSFEAALEPENDTEESPVKQICLSDDRNSPIKHNNSSFVVNNLNLHDTNNTSLDESELRANLKSVSDKRSNEKLSTQKTEPNDVIVRLDSHEDMNLSVNDYFSLHVTHDFSKPVVNPIVNDDFSLHVTHDFSKPVVNPIQEKPSKEVTSVLGSTLSLMAEDDINNCKDKSTSFNKNEECVTGPCKFSSQSNLTYKTKIKETSASKNEKCIPSRTVKNDVFSLHAQDYRCCKEKSTIVESREGVFSLNLIPKWIQLEFSKQSDGVVSLISHKLYSERNKNIGEYLLRRVQLLTLPRKWADLVDHASEPTYKFLSNIAKQLNVICNYHCGQLNNDILSIEIVNCSKKIWAFVDINVKYPQYLNATDISLSKQILGNLRITEIRSIFDEIERTPDQLLNFVKALNTNINLRH